MQDATDRTTPGRMAEWSLMLLCVLLPLAPRLVPAALVLALVVGLVLAWRARPAIRLRPLWPLFLWYALHVLGMLWTSDTAAGLFDLEVKLGVVAAPLAVALILAVAPKALERGMVALTAGILLSVVPGLWWAWGCYEATGIASCFSQSTLSHALHPSYAAWYACWALAWWGHALVAGKVGRRHAAILVVCAVLVLWTAMLASKAGIIALLLVLGWLFIAALRRHRGRVRSWTMAAVLLAAALAVWVQGPLVVERMQAAARAVQDGLAGDPSIVSSAEGNHLRIVAWTCSMEEWGTAPWGAGTGDIKHALMDCYTAKGAEQAALRRLNSHSQFLQGGVALGWPGALATLLLLIVPLARGWGRRDVPMLLFALLFLVNAAVESVLEVQAGVVFFGLFLGALLTRRA